mmetsp:Transcript_20179/g.47035  ORF Transcript_20179/g.47035 Transcript_20179/m.47035 type:complete len:282 (-) Transcript_20179:2291-3136(-)
MSATLRYAKLPLIQKHQLLGDRKVRLQGQIQSVVPRWIVGVESENVLRLCLHREVILQGCPRCQHHEARSRRQFQARQQPLDRGARHLPALQELLYQGGIANEILAQRVQQARLLSFAAVVAFPEKRHLYKLVEMRLQPGFRQMALQELRKRIRLCTPRSGLKRLLDTKHSGEHSLCWHNVDTIMALQWVRILALRIRHDLEGSLEWQFELVRSLAKHSQQGSMVRTGQIQLVESIWVHKAEHLKRLQRSFLHSSAAAGLQRQVFEAVRVLDQQPQHVSHA